MKITVFTPSYNRARLIHRVYDSLVSQSFRDFEWLIIDDGSSDNTEAVVDKFSREADFPIRYFKRENRGKARSINDALELACGEFFLVFDSDDWCTSDALEKFIGTWNGLEKPDEYCAVSALKGYSHDEIVGEDYSRMRRFGESYVHRFSLQIKGDKWEFIKTAVHREFLYELADGERYQAPEYAWLAMGKSYKTIFLDEILGVVEYQEDGISKNNLKHRVGSPLSAYRFYRRGSELALRRGVAMRCELNAARFAFHARKAHLLSHLSFLSIVFGAVLFVRDVTAAFVTRLAVRR